MRRALVLAALLAAPVLAAAQAAGSVLFVNGRDFPMYVNATECQGGTNRLVAWRSAFVNGYSVRPANGVYAIYASNIDPAMAGPSTCFTSSNAATGLVAGSVPDAQGIDPITMQNAVIDLGAFLGAAGMSCADDGATVFICVQGTVAGTRFAYAAAAVTISTTIPPAPVITGLTPDDAAVRVTWDPGEVTSAHAGDSHAYQLSAEMIATTAAATDATTHLSPMLATTTARLGALENTVTYAVTVTAYSKAGNASEASPPATATPRASPRTGDGSGGGCGSGPAGPLSLAILAGVLALARRPRRALP
jgi:hypothetical protein